MFNLMGMYVLVYCVLFAFVSSEDAQNKAGKWFQALTALFFVGVLVASYFGEIGAIVSFWVTVAFVIGVLAVDIIWFAGKRQWRVFYIPFFVEVLVVGIAALLAYFEAPQRWCRDSKAVQLYFNSDVLYSILFVNFLFELHNILYYTLKVNSNYLNDDDQWWKIRNIYNN